MDKSRRKSKYTIMVPEFINLYKQGYNCHSIGRKLNVDYRKVWSHLKKEGITLKRTTVNRKYTIDENSFDILDKNSLYWLGCLYGDGSVFGNSKANYIALHGHSNDVEHGYLFKYFLKSEHPVKILKKKKGYYFSFASSKMINRLFELGLHQNKTHTMKYPNYIPYEFQSHFIRGLFDTDGCICVRKRKGYNTLQGTFSITMNKDMLEATKDILIEQLGITPTSLRLVNNTKSYVLSYEGNKRLRKIYEWLYKDAEYFLLRKKNKFMTLFSLS